MQKGFSEARFGVGRFTYTIELFEKISLLEKFLYVWGAQDLGFLRTALFL